MDTVQKTSQKPTIIFRGHHFTEGVLAALRAYPNVLAVQCETMADSAELSVVLNQPVRDAMLIEIITRAGGSIKAIVYRSPHFGDNALIEGEDKPASDITDE